MDKLGAYDQFFYKADQYRVASLIMGGVSILEPAIPGDKLVAEDIAKHLAARLQTIPLLRKKFVQDPLRLGTVRKVEDPQFDVWNHIVTKQLPKPGGYRELTRCMAKLSATPLQPGQLWRWTIIDGLAAGRLAVMCQIHHALADGVGIVEVLSSMYDESPVPPETPAAQPAGTTREPSAYALLRDSIAEAANRLYVKTPRFLLQNTVPILSALRGNAQDRLGDDTRASDTTPPTPTVQSTSLNIKEPSDNRAVAYKTLALPEIKALSRHFSCTINDIGLLLYSFAMQHYFERSGEQVDFDLWCAVPISTRSADSAQGGNQVTIGRVNLHNTIAQATARLHAISQDTAQAKRLARPEKPLLDIEEVAELIFPSVLDGLLYVVGKLNLLGRLSDKFPLANALMSNVPGPPQPVYIANASMVENIPLIPVIDVVAVSGGLVSVDQVITIGFHCYGDAVSDPELFVEGVELGLKELHKSKPAAPGASNKEARKRSTRRQRGVLALDK